MNALPTATVVRKRHGRAGAVLMLTLTACVVPPPTTVIIRAGRLIDGSGGPVIWGQRIVVQDGLIASVEADGEPIPEALGAAAVIDARQMTVMPGLIDAHVHAFAGGACVMGLDAGVGQAVRNLAAFLRAGITTVADLGAPAPAAVGLRRYIGTARQRGPRLLVAGPILTAPDGYPLDMLGRDAVKSGMVVEVDSADSGRSVVQNLVGQKIDLIKLALQEASFNAKPLKTLDEKTVCAIVDEAHRQHLRVMVHATGRAGYHTALTCGADVLAHGLFEPATPELLADLVRHGTWVMPTHLAFAGPVWGPEHLDLLDRPDVHNQLTEKTLTNLRVYEALDKKHGPMLPPFILPGISRSRLESALDIHAASTRAMRNAGVNIALGTDTGICYNLAGFARYELAWLVQDGFTPLAALHAATAGSARALGLGDALGLIAPGYRADIIVVDGQPDQNIEAVENVRRVLIDGVEQHLHEPTVIDTTMAAGFIAWNSLTGSSP